MYRELYKKWVVECDPVRLAEVVGKRPVPSGIGGWVKDGLFTVGVLTRDKVLRHLAEQAGEPIIEGPPFDLWLGLYDEIETWATYHGSSAKLRHVAYQRYGSKAREFMEFVKGLRK